jgi:hypothetical protein
MVVNKVDCWGQEVYRGEQIIVGKYYKWQGWSPQSYVLCDGGSIFVYSHLVIALKLNMIVAQHRQGRGIAKFQVYTFPTKAFNDIQTMIITT